MAMLIARVRCKTPSQEDINAICEQVEGQMAGQPLNAETAFTFTEEVRRRLIDMIEVELA
ncbi:MAG: hypothetical protein E6Z83_08060 [Pantoea sp.]|uniref:hypothetical protein n=1 Tax=Pantoea sp. TaxID=69393 RepID=UPI00290C4543|nr:hypothetical protein [Pantoea sp.]MDU5780750.1 hypothetical protein [Pantoea sp.]